MNKATVFIFDNVEIRGLPLTAPARETAAFVGMSYEQFRRWSNEMGIQAEPTTSHYSLIKVVEALRDKEKPRTLSPLEEWRRNARSET